MRRLTPLICLLALVESVQAQSFYAARRERAFVFTAGTGVTSYFGELANPGDYLDTKPNISVGLQYSVNNRFAVRGEVNWFQLQGDDADADDNSRVRRNLSFSSDNFEVNLTGHLSLVPQGKRFYQRPNFNLYAFAGIGLLWFNPTAKDSLGNKYSLQPLQTEQVDYSRIGFVVPVGLGVKFKLNPFFNLSIEGGYRKTFTDYLDDVSTVHPGPAAFSDPVAAYFSDRRPELGINPVEPGTQRGDPDDKDGYLLLNLRVEYYLPIQKSYGGNQNKLLKKRRNAYYRYNKRGGVKKRR